MKLSETTPVEVGSLDNNNHRVINKYIHNDGIQSCQLVLGVTNFKKGSIWNTMPPHLHDRRMESYFYFDLSEGQRIIHFMGQPQETRHIFLNNEEAFIWAMAGENKVLAIWTRRRFRI